MKPPVVRLNLRRYRPEGWHGTQWLAVYHRGKNLGCLARRGDRRWVMPGFLDRQVFERRGDALRAVRRRVTEMARAMGRLHNGQCTEYVEAVVTLGGKVVR